ncbi:MAG: tetratricopeptide repeat protein [Kiritimatiellae bacterium]|nr:tetratricopeptide repeat protein [Kiritimatiellia bacterium]
MNGSNNDCGNRMWRPDLLRRGAALALLVLLPLAANAQSGELPEKPAYQQMLAGDRALEAGDAPRALGAYQEALTLFERLRRERPNYKPAAIEYRMDYCRKRIAALLGDPAVQAAAAQPRAPAPADRLRELQASLEQLQRERESLQHELAELRRQLERATSRADSAEANLAELRAQLAATQQQSAALERELAAARANVPVAEHREALAALRAAETERAALQRRVEAAERTTTALQERLAAAESRARELEATVADPARLTAPYEQQLREARERADAAARREAATAARAESLAAQLHAAREEIAALKASATSAARGGDTAPARELQQVTAERDAAAAEVARLRTELERLEAERRDDRERIRELGRALKSAAEPAARAEQELRALLEKTIAERDAAREQAATLQLRVRELEAARTESPEPAANTDAALAETREQLRRSEARLQALAAKLDLRDREAREAERERDALRQELERVRAERDRLQESATRRPPESSPTTTATPPPIPELPPELQQQLETAVSLLASNQVAPALDLFDRVLSAAPDHPDALLGYGRAALALGQLRPARAAAERLTDRHPQLAAGHHLLGLVEARDNNRRAAGRAFAKAVALEPNNPTYHRDFAIACYKLNRLDDAIAEYREVIRLHPNDGQAHFNLAALLMSLPNPPLEEIRALYRRARELGEPPDAQLEQRLGL